MSMLKFHRCALVALALSVLTADAGSLAFADQPKPEDKPPPVTKVKLRQMPAIAKTGKVAMYRGEADGKGVAFYVDGLGIGTPVGVMLLSGAKGAPMKLSVKNDLSADWDRKVDPDKDGVAQTRFRTEGPAMILVSSPGEMKPYQLIIWVGPEIKFHKYMKTPFVSQEAYDKSQGGGVLGPIIAGAALALVVVIVIMVRRSQKRRGQ